MAHCLLRMSNNYVKNKQTIKQLETLKEILSKEFSIDAYLENESPYIYLRAKIETPFQGVRIYKIGSNWAYRIQNESETEPYGKAYPIDIERMFEDLIPDMSEDEAGGVIADALIEEFNNFFDKNTIASSSLPAVFTSSKASINSLKYFILSGDSSISVPSISLRVPVLYTVVAIL
jgi:hypothetical protein